MKLIRYLSLSLLHFLQLSSNLTPSLPHIFTALSNTLKLPESAYQTAEQNGFEIKGYSFEARREELRKPRLVRIGAIQNSIALPTTAPIEKQREGIWSKVKIMIKAAAEAGCNIVCTQEAWSKYSQIHP